MKVIITSEVDVEEDGAAVKLMVETDSDEDNIGYEIVDAIIGTVKALRSVLEEYNIIEKEDKRSLN